jgi:hypothetical protein
LRNGSVLEGKVEELDVNGEAFYLITLDDGSLLKLHRRLVRRVERPSAAEQEYVRRSAGMADTVEAHWQMQEWCRDQQLRKAREFHLQRIVQLDPNHKDARLLLDYIFEDGRWVHKDHFYSSQGYVRDQRNRWRLPQGIEIVQQQEAFDASQVEWTQKLRLLVKQWEKDHDQRPLEEIRAATDPTAWRGLQDIFEDSKHQAIEDAVIDAASQMPAVSQGWLIKLALENNDDRIRQRAIEILKRPEFDVGRTILSLEPFMTPGVDTPNDRVNRAGYLLGALGDQRAVRMLINGLRTTHAIKNPAAGSNLNPGFGTGGSGFTAGEAPKVIQVALENQSVLDSLRALTGTDFGYNQAGWLDWYIDNRTVNSVDLRRDD